LVTEAVHPDEVTLTPVSDSRSAHVDKAQAAALYRDLRSGAAEHLGVLDGSPVLIIDLDHDREIDLGALPAHCSSVVIGVGTALDHADLMGVDVVVTPGDIPGGVAADLDELVACIERSPAASVILAQILRSGEGRPLDEALLYESLAYSTLQGGVEFQAWLAARGPREPLDEEGASFVRLERRERTLTITLARPERRNALGARMRDQLCEALELAATDPEIVDVVLQGDGANFSSGGDLNEFGTSPDPAIAHLVRLTRSPARRLAALGVPSTARLHGACFGAGIELPSFADHVVADPTTRICLPELALGLIPGAGGTVSIPRRIGRHRTAWLALSGAELSAGDALSWGLIDEIAPVP